MNYINRIYFKDFRETGTYLDNIPSISYFRNGGELEFPTPVTFFVGENGSGKSTLMEGIVAQMGLNLEGGSKHFNFSSTDKIAVLEDFIMVSRTSYPKDCFFFKAESFYNAATYIHEIKLDDQYGERSLHEQSHGQKLLSLIKKRFRGNGLYLLDEPESALSPQSQLALLALINDLIENHSQFIISTHSPIILSFPNATIYELSENGIDKISYEDTEVYNLFSSFLSCPERYLKHLF